MSPEIGSARALTPSAATRWAKRALLAGVSLPAALLLTI